MKLFYYSTEKVDFTENSFLSKKAKKEKLTLYSVENEKFGLTKKIFRQINYLVLSLVKTLLSRNFCQKCVRLCKSQQFPHTVRSHSEKFRESNHDLQRS